MHHQARKYGKTKFGLNRFVNGYLDLLSLWFLSRFGIKPMHFFGLLGSLMFIFGFIAVVIVGVSKLYYMHHGMPYRLVTDSPYFYLSLTSMIIGTQLFVAGFLGELISRNAPERNKYQIEKPFNDEKISQTCHTRSYPLPDNKHSYLLLGGGRLLHDGTPHGELHSL